MKDSKKFSWDSVFPLLFQNILFQPSPFNHSGPCHRKQTLHNAHAHTHTHTHTQCQSSPSERLTKGWAWVSRQLTLLGKSSAGNPCNSVPVPSVGRAVSAFSCLQSPGGPTHPTISHTMNANPLPSLGRTTAPPAGATGLGGQSRFQCRGVVAQNG